MPSAPAIEYEVRLHRPHAGQQRVIDSPAKRKIIRAGRRGGKTDLMASLAVQAWLRGLRVLYAAPTVEQLTSFWFEVCRALQEPIDSGAVYKNEGEHVIEIRGTKNRIKAKTAWNADTLRGDFADELILDEWQLMDEQAWSVVGAPMLLDNDGNVTFCYTPPSLESRSVSKARDPLHAKKMFMMAEKDKTDRWEAFHFTSHDNPHISVEALAEISKDMTSLAIAQEIEARDVDEAPGALWSRALIAKSRCDVSPELIRIVTGVDPPGGATECGVVTVGKSLGGQIFVTFDNSLRSSPDRWAAMIIDTYRTHSVDRIVAEKNYGGDMVESTLKQAAKAREVDISFRLVHATRGKAVRAEPVAALFEQGRAYFVGDFPHLEEELTSWVPGETRAKFSPNRLDAMVWAVTELMDKGRPDVHFL